MRGVPEFARFVFSIIATVVVLSATGHAAEINAPSCAQADVQGALDSAATGDVVSVPPGRCRWDGPVDIAEDKKITLTGAGMNATIITMRSGGGAVDMNRSGSRVTGFWFNDGYVVVDGDGWRVDSCRFYSESEFGEGVMVRGERLGEHAEGLVDHCEFHNTRVLVYGTAAMLGEGDDQHVLWFEPLTLGSVENVVYVEDCEFTATVHANAVDANYGGAYVFRYNTLNDIYIEAHSVQGDNRASRRWEIYGNTINQVERSMWVPMFLRGGTGVVFDNVLTGTWTQPNIALDNVRSCDPHGSGGQCDGTSPWDGNEPGQAGYPCRDQIGRSTDQWQWTAANPYPPQSLDPAYCWNNTFNGNDVAFFQHGCAESRAHIQPDRDYFNNVEKPGYVRGPYPHPLFDAWGGEVTDPGQPPPDDRKSDSCGCRSQNRKPNAFVFLFFLIAVAVWLRLSARRSP